MAIARMIFHSCRFIAETLESMDLVTLIIKMSMGMLVCHPVIPLLKNHAVLKEKFRFTSAMILITAGVKTLALPLDSKIFF